MMYACIVSPSEDPHLRIHRRYSARRLDWEQRVCRRRRNMNYEGPRNVNYNNWIAPQRTVEDQYYATSPFPGTCERLVTTRIDFKTRVNGSLSKFNINVFSRLLVSCLLFFYLS